ncbi:hypothetical protein [Paraburkholderia bryophila]|uniref:Uncharacterized protein n=1 Tax=Paraburkholderia bryophila TaxID=420952 RepID=A0A7Y9WJH1_9BURK|nr:hypothetical protein [Paraburkholderia bryophila]NYH21405.1 hypothetical protein [Paraburkholderia bryophila]
MQVFVNIPLKSLRRVRGRAQSTYHGDWFKATRLYGPVCESHDRSGGTFGRGYIHADIEIGDDLREHVSVAGFNEDGTIRVQVWVNTHRKTLAAFLASGEPEWNVREMA